MLGLEQFDPLHERGSSHGLTRIIRLAYHEHPSYVPLLRRAYELWHELESQVEERLLVTTGSLEGGPEDGATFTGALEAARLHDLPHDGPRRGGDLGAAFPPIANLPLTTRAVLQPDGGFLLAERTILAHTQACAMTHGADLRYREPVLRLERPGRRGPGHHRGWLVRRRSPGDLRRAPGRASSCRRWRDWAVPERQVLAWLQPIRPDLFQADAFPVFLLDVEEGSFYGFPIHDVPGFKFGKYHHLREPIDSG